MPRNTQKTYRRGIVLNRHKIRFWLAQGAEPTRSAAKILSRFGEDFWPRPVIPGGIKTIYEQPEKKFLAHGFNNKKFAFMQNPQFKYRQLLQEEMNVIER